MVKSCRGPPSRRIHSRRMSFVGSPNQRASLSLRERQSGSGLIQEKGTSPRGSSLRKPPSFAHCQPAALADSRDEETGHTGAPTFMPISSRTLILVGELVIDAFPRCRTYPEDRERLSVPSRLDEPVFQLQLGLQDGVSGTVASSLLEPGAAWLKLRDHIYPLSGLGGESFPFSGQAVESADTFAVHDRTGRAAGPQRLDRSAGGFGAADRRSLGAVPAA